MSFDVSLHCKHCGSQTFDWNITHNVNSIVEACIVEAAGALGLPLPKSRRENAGYSERSWGRFEQWTGHDAAPILARAVEIANSADREAALQAMQPSNGWGSLSGVREALAKLHAACVANPQCIIRASG